MRSSIFALSALLLVCSLPAGAQKKKEKGVLPELVLNAQYVMVMSMDGPDITDGTPEDRRIRGEMERAILTWKRYRLVHSAADADLIFVIRAGRLGSASGGVRLGTSGTGTIMGGDLGPREDMFAVYPGSAGTGLRGSPLFIRRQMYGLDLPAMPLFQHFRYEVQRGDRMRRERELEAIIEKKVRSLGAEARLSKKETEETAAAIVQRIKNDAQMSANVLNGASYDIERLFKERHPQK